MEIFDPNELAATLIDQAHTIRVQAGEIQRLQREIEGLRASLVAHQAAPTGEHDDYEAPAT